MTVSTLVDLVKIQIVSTGTGIITMGAAVPGYRGVEALLDGQTYSYSIQQNGNYEVGTGTYLASGNRFTRSPQVSSAGGAPIGLATGANLVFTARAADFAVPGLPGIPGTPGAPGAPGAAGAPGGNITATGLATAIPSTTFPGGIDAIHVTGHSQIGKGAGWLVRWTNIYLSLPTIGAGVNPWWWTSLDGNQWFYDPTALEYGQFGGIGNCPSTLGATGTDNFGAFLAYAQYCEWIQTQQIYDEFTPVYYSNPKLSIKGGNYYHSAMMPFDFGTVHWEGEASGPQNGGKRVVITCGAAGMQVYWAGGSARSGAADAAGSVFRNIAFRYSGAPTTNTIHGITVNADQCLFDNCSVLDFPGHGAFIMGNTGGTPPSNANLTTFRGGSYRSNGRSAIGQQGGDANIVVIDNVDMYSNGEWANDDNSFLGAHLSNNLADSNGVIGAGSRLHPQTIGSLCNIDGFRWAVALGQAGLASTQRPGTGGAWVKMYAGGAHAIFPTWVSGMTFKEGGAYVTRQPAGQACLDFCYSEGTQGPSQFTTTTIGFGGLHAAGYVGGSIMSGVNNAIVAPSFGIRTGQADGTLASNILGGGGNGTLRIFGRGPTGETQWREFADATGNVWVNALGLDAGNAEILVLGGIHPYSKSFPNGAYIGSLFQTSAAAQPAAGSWNEGDWVENTLPVVSGGKVLRGWKRLTTGSGNVAGTDWTPIYGTTS